MKSLIRLPEKSWKRPGESANVLLPLTEHSMTWPGSGAIRPGDEPTLARAICMAASHEPFDPNATVDDFPLLHAIARRPKTYECSGIAGRVLPATLDTASLDTIGRAGGGPADVDFEWLAGLLVAAGADPWQKARAGNLPGGVPLQTDALDWALQHVRPALIRRLLECPGAPDASDVAVASPVLDARNGDCWWRRLCRSGSIDACTALEHLQALGADPHLSGSDGMHPLGDAHPDCVMLYRRRGWLPTQRATVEKIKRRWGVRAARAELQHGTYVKMLDAFGTVGDELKESLQQEVAVGQLISCNIGGLTSSTRATPDLLNRQTDIVAVNGHGRWNGLTAFAYNELRAGGRFGPGLLARRLGSSQSDLAGLGLSPASMDFDWRPGIPAAGFVALAIFGGRDDDDGAGTGARRSIDPLSLNLLALLGVNDVAQWARHSVSAAAKVTVAILGGRFNDTHARGLDYAWRNVVATAGGPSQWGEDGWRAAADVVLALNGNWRVRLRAFIGALRPHLAQVPKDVSDEVLCQHARTMLQCAILAEKVMLAGGSGAARSDGTPLPNRLADAVLSHPAWRAAAWPDMAMDILRQARNSPILDAVDLAQLEARIIGRCMQTKTDCLPAAARKAKRSGI